MKLVARPGRAVSSGWLWPAARVAAAAAVVVRAARATGAQPPVEPLPEPGAPGPSVSVVVPARDEAARIGPCLASLLADPGVAEVLVVDDQSTDGTAEVAEAAGARVVRGSPLPEGWAGKPWALQQGIEAASGEWVVTLDADTVSAVGLVGALVRRAEQGGYHLVTAGGRFACPDRVQQVVHPALLTTLVYRFGPVGATHQPPPHRLVANGQCMAFRRLALRDVGGFDAVRGSLVEDVALVRHLAARHWRIGFLDATGSLLVLGYASAAEAWRGWGRSLPLGEVTSPAWLAADLGVVWLAQALPLVRLVARRADALDLVLLALRAGTLAGTRRAYDRPSAAYWLSPLADVPAAVRLTQAALRPERRWRGRSYAAPGGSAGR